MTIQKVYIQFVSDRDPKQLEAFLIRSLEKAGASVSYYSHREVAAGRPKVNRPKVEGYLADSCAVGDKITVIELMEALDLTEKAAGSVLRELTKEKWLSRHYIVGEPAEYTVLRNK